MRGNVRRVLAVASGGGHWIELRRLSSAFEGADVAYVSVVPSNCDDVAGHRYYNIRDVSRFALGSLAVVALQCLRILWRERPDVVVTTGSAPGFVMLALAKSLFRRRTMWIDSIAQIDDLSASGKAAGYFADVWLTQWRHLSRPGGPDYWGAVL